MSPKFYVTCLWPGMTELWWRGRLSALPTALAFAAALNLMLIIRFLYPEWLSSGLVRLGCWIGAAIWLFFVVQAMRDLRAVIAPRTASKEPDRFPDARTACLKGDWEEAEGLLADLLAIESRDPPALLLLCGIYRRTGRVQAAQQLLDEISRLEVADGWWLEVEAERKRLRRLTAAEEAAEDDESGVEEDVAADSDQQVAA